LELDFTINYALKSIKIYNTPTLWDFNHESPHTTFDPIDLMTQYLAIEKP